MDILFSIFLGIIQGLTEFLPVSSSGHLVIFREVFGFQGTYAGGLFFDTLLHIGTLVSVFIIFFKDIKELVVEFFGLIRDLIKRKKNPIEGKPYRRMLIMLIIATLPMFLMVPFVGVIDRLFQSLLIVGIALLVTGTFLFLSVKIPQGRKDASNAKFRSALFVGFVQMFAVIPGISRSGSTIVAGEATGFTRKFAAKFSFLMSILAILGATVVQIPGVIEERAAEYIVISDPLSTLSGYAADTMITNALALSPAAYIAGIIAAAISGIIAIKYMLRLIDKGKFHYFAYYCWAVGTFAIIANFFLT
ncbi:MAG: undecaprenyl-diphosphate phosphatase [Oscillospiraceae bacterium]|nr:undecaprenyl-diphosphate phosphatase [Oscillospiraceae bacterium]